MCLLEGKRWLRKVSSGKVNQSLVTSEKEPVAIPHFYVIRTGMRGGTAILGDRIYWAWRPHGDKKEEGFKAFSGFYPL